MFYYLSFLRPPPLQASTSAGSIKLTPQIANDLRTELYSGTQDIFCAWVSGAQSTRPNKLTSWKPSSAYKELSIPLPSGARPGQSWRLVLTSRPVHPHISLDGCSKIGHEPFPVISMPIQICAGSDKTLLKQEEVERIYWFGERSITIREKTSFDLDKKVWDSGIGCSSWLVDLAKDELPSDASPLLSKAKEILVKSARCNAIELGAGTGIFSITLGAIRSACHPDGEQGCIFTTDLPSAMPLLSYNISTNAQLFVSSSLYPQAFALNWDDGELPIEVQRDEEGFDAILMADVTYNTASFPSLIRTIASLVDHNKAVSKPPPLIVLGYKERDPDERTLWPMMKDQLGVTLEQVGECSGSGGAPIEFWIGT